MLPLWIIDLRESTIRRDCFERLVGQMDHVYIVGKENETQTSEQILANDYWRYSKMDDYFYGISIKRTADDKQSTYADDHLRDTIEEKPTAEGTANRLYKFQSDLVAEGQRFIKQLRASDAHPDIKINVVVLGDVTQELTRIVFPAIAGILQKEKGRMLPHHIHQGMEVIGMLFIPSDINTRDVNLRKSIQRTLNEIDVQYRVNDIRGYDHMMFYQDVQNRTECSYPILNDEQLSQYLLQCLVHLYYACDDSHPLISGTASSDVFYFSMGVTSVHYDTEEEDLKCQHKLMVDYIRNFKSEGVDEKETQELRLIAEDDYNPESFFDFNSLSKLESDDIEEENPSPHPVRDYMAKFLKRYYYNLYLRFFTANMMHRIINQMDECTRASLESISTQNKRRFKDAQVRLFANLKDVIGKISANDGGLPRIIGLFKEMQNNLSQKRLEIQKVLEQKFWRKIEEEYISKDIIDRFTEYHDAYVTDIRNKNGGTNQQELKNQAVTELNGILGNESTMLSRICRSLLLGIMGALAIVPVLNILSPHIINLGRIRRNGELWSIGIFCLPLLWQIVSFYRYSRKKKRAINNLKAMYLHDAYARVANRIDSEINLFYDRFIALADRYIGRCVDIRNELGKDLDEAQLSKHIIPVTMFNQPLIGGHFGDAQLLPLKESDDTEVRINYIRYKLSDLTNTEYFLYINQSKNIIMDLFRDVTLCENLIRRLKEDGTEELVTKEQQEEEQHLAWERHKKEFTGNLMSFIKDSIIEREDATIGEKLYHYCSSNPDQAYILKPMVAYAATNGEITSSADTEYIDAKTNDKRVELYLSPFISCVRNQVQYDKYNKIFKKYLFVTRWRCFEHFNLNRILPAEDFDEKIRIKYVYEAEVKSKNKRQVNNIRSMEEEKKQKEHPEGMVYLRKTSSLLLWALCPDDSSPEWFRLFDSEFFAEAYNDKNTFRRILNQHD